MSKLIQKDNLFIVTGDIDADTSGQIALATMTKAPITLWLNSGGGCSRQGLECARMIANHGKVTIVAFGECMSAAIDMLCAAKNSKATPTCEFLVHYGEQSATTKDEERRNRKLFKEASQYLYKKVTVTKRTVTRWFNQDRYFTAEEALKVGLIDEIID